MQTLEKLAHSTMPFTTGGQTITDRLNAAKHSLAGSQLGKTICKATTEELMAPKKKHLDYLLHCTNEPNVSIPSMANLLIERTQNPNWVVVYKSLITIHNLMCYGNERFSQYLASCNTTFNLTNFVDKSSLQNGALAAGYDMSTHVRRYGKYVSEKIHTYRLCAFDFCKVKRGRDDGLLRTLHTDKLLKTMPILQAQLDALLEFQVNSSELNNGVISTSFILLFRDLIRLFACYNDGVINLLEKFFDMNKKQCREALDLYKAFLARLDRVSAFLSIAESVGIDRGEVPDLTRAPASLLEALESHVYHLEGGRGPPPTVPQQMVSQQIHAVHQEQLFQPQYAVDEMAKQRYLEEEKERLRQYEEQRRRQLQQQGAPTSSGPPPAPSTNPFGPPSAAAADLLFFETPPKNANPGQGDASNPFAMVAEINNRSQQGQMPFNASGPLVANPFLASAGPQPHAFPPPQPPMAPPAVNPFSAAPQPPFGYGTPNAYSQQGGGGGGGGQPYWPSTTPMNTPQPGLGIYSQTPFSGTDGSYSAPSALQQNMEQAPQRPPHPPSQQQQFTPQWPPANNGTANRPTQQSDGLGRDVDTALSSLVGNLGIAGAGNGAQQRNNQQPPYGQAQPPQWPPAQYGQQQTPFGAPYPPPNGGNPYAAAGGH